MFNIDKYVDKDDITIININVNKKLLNDNKIGNVSNGVLINILFKKPYLLFVKDNKNVEKRPNKQNTIDKIILLSIHNNINNDLLNPIDNKTWNCLIFSIRTNIVLLNIIIDDIRIPIKPIKKYTFFSKLIAENRFVYSIILFLKS